MPIERVRGEGIRGLNIKVNKTIKIFRIEILMIGKENFSIKKKV